MLNILFLIFLLYKKMKRTFQCKKMHLFFSSFFLLPCSFFWFLLPFWTLVQLTEKKVFWAVSWWRAGHLCWLFHLCCCCYHLLEPVHAVLVDKCVPGCDDGGFLLLFV